MSRWGDKGVRLMPKMSLNNLSRAIAIIRTRQTIFDRATCPSCIAKALANRRAADEFKKRVAGRIFL